MIRCSTQFSGWGRWLSVVCGVLGLVPQAAAQDDRSQAPLATKQQIIRDRVLRLEDQMYRLIEKLKEQEPQQAKRLQAVLGAMGELNVRQDLADIIDDLADDRLESAIEQQDALLKDFGDLLQRLMATDDDNEQRQREIERLEDMAGRLDGLIDEQEALAEETATAEDTRQAMKSDPEAAAAIEALLQRQQDVYGGTQARYRKQPGAPSGEELANVQRELVQQAEQLVRMLEVRQEQAAAEAVDAARLNMQDAVDELGNQAYGAAGDAQEDAMADLKRSLEKLTKKPGDSGDEPDLDKLAREQADLGRQAQQLGSDMQNPQLPAPGGEQVDAAGEHMDQASEALDQRSTAQAREEQEQALERLEQARAQVQRELDALKRRQQEQKLADLLERFRNMLDAQNSINAATVRLHDVGLENWRRAHQLEAVEQKHRQLDQAEAAEACLQILREDGTTTVVPSLVEHLRGDMNAIGQRLGAFQVGAVTQTLQSDVVAGLEDILSAIEDKLNAPPSDQPPPPPQNAQGDPPLLPTSAELRLLANRQQRVFKRTQSYNRAGEKDAGELQRIAVQQSDIARLATELNDALKRPRTEPQDPGE